jgi:Epoxide hydrolase N terminus
VPALDSEDHVRVVVHNDRCRFGVTEGEETKMTAEDDTIRPFQVGFAEAEVTELRRRVSATRWPERETVGDDSQGVRLALMQDLAAYWGSGYDWRKSGLEDEYRLSADKPRLIYMKKTARREPRLKSFLEAIEAEGVVSYRHFEDADELASLVADDLALLLTERFVSPPTPRRAPPGSWLGHRQDQTTPASKSWISIEGAMAIRPFNRFGRFLHPEVADRRSREWEPNKRWQPARGDLGSHPVAGAGRQATPGAPGT